MIEPRPAKPEGHDYHRCKCDPCRAVKRWMAQQFRAQRRAAQQSCAVVGCGKSASGHSLYCGAHHARKYEKGDIGPVGTRTNDGVPRTYSRAHTRITSVRGSATRYACVDCHARANDWSLKNDAAARTIATTGDHRGCAFSPLLEDYEPRCRPCHARYDAEARRGHLGAAAS